MARFSEFDPLDPGYTDLRPAEPTRHEVPPDSWLAQAAAGALRSPSDRPAPAAGQEVVEVTAAADWDPLTDPWPTRYAGLEPAALGHCVGEEVDPLGLCYDTAAWAPANSSTEIASPADITFAFPPALDEPEIVVGVPVRARRREEQAAIQTQPVELGEHPSGPLPRAGVWPPQNGVPESPASLVQVDAPVARYDVTLMGPLGDPEFGFGGGRWYSLIGEQTREVPVGDALSAHPDKAGQIVQLACWWLREQPNTARALDLATELSMAVAELARRELSRGRRRSA